MAKMSDFLIGTKFRFQTKDSDYEGIVESVFYSRKRVTFKNVKSLPDYNDLGRLKVFKDEIYSFKKIEIENNSSDILINKNESENKLKVHSESTVRTTSGLFNKSGDLNFAETSRISNDSFCKAKSENILPYKIKVHTESAAVHSSSGLFNKSGQLNFFKTSRKSNEANSVSKSADNVKKLNSKTDLKSDCSQKTTSQNTAKSERKIRFIPAGMNC